VVNDVVTGLLSEAVPERRGVPAGSCDTIDNKPQLRYSAQCEQWVHEALSSGALCTAMKTLRFNEPSANQRTTMATSGSLWSTAKA
jgi:hypothetical protein